MKVKVKKAAERSVTLHEMYEKTWKKLSLFGHVQ